MTPGCAPMKPRPTSSTASLRLTATDRTISWAETPGAIKSPRRIAAASLRTCCILLRSIDSSSRVIEWTLMRRRPSSKNRTPVPLHATEQAPSLQSAHESIIAAQVKPKVWLELGGEFMIGDGGLHLLGGIAEHGSLAQAVRKIRWSYRHAWGYLRRAERALETPIVRNRPGRGTARGMELTVTGRLLLERLRA